MIRLLSLSKYENDLTQPFFGDDRSDFRSLIGIRIIDFCLSEHLDLCQSQIKANAAKVPVHVKTSALTKVPRDLATLRCR